MNVIVQLLQLIPLVQNPNYFLVISRSNKAFVVSILGELLYTFETEGEEAEFIGGCISIHVGIEWDDCDLQGKYLYCMSSDGVRYCYTAENGKLVEKKKMVEHELLGIIHSPTLNEMISYSQKGELLQWST